MPVVLELAPAVAARLATPEPRACPFIVTLSMVALIISEAAETEIPVLDTSTPRHANGTPTRVAPKSMDEVTEAVALSITLP